MIVDSYPKMRFVKSKFIPVKNLLLNKHSDAESHFVNLLTKANIYFFREKCNFKMKTRWCYYDFYIPYYRVYIEIDGKSHDNDEQKKIDKQKTQLARSRQKYVARFTNGEILAMNEISIDIILERVYEGLKSKKNRTQKERYERTLRENYYKSVSDMYESANFDIDKDKKVYLYDNFIGNYIEFDSIIEAKLQTQLSINNIYSLLEQKEYKHSVVRRYVFGWTLDECENHVAQTYY